MRTPPTPPGWATAKIPQLVSPGGVLVDGDWVESKDQDPDGAVRLTQLADIGDGIWRNRSSRFMTPEKAAELRCTLLERGDVLVARMPDPLGRSCIFPGDTRHCVTVVDVCIVRPGNDGVSTKWLSHFINAPGLRTSIYDLQSGSTRKRISRKNLCTLDLRIPPTNEQHRIVEAIESYFTRLDDAVATLERVQRNLERYRASVLKAAVEGRLVPTEAELARAEGRDYEPASALLERILAERRRRWEEAELAKMKAKGTAPNNDKWKAKYKEPVEPDAGALPDLPEGWYWASLPQLGELNRGKSKHRPRNDPRLLGGPYPFIQTGDVRHSDGFITEHTATYSAFGLAQSRLWPAGTLCITIAANIADTAILRFDACFPDSVVGFLNEREGTLVRFVELFIRTAKQELDRYAPATAQKNINLAALSAVAVPVPPLAEQERIVAEVDRLLSVGAAAEATAMLSAVRATGLRQSILKWAFDGLLADQDPDDEPATELLERIAAEREGFSRTNGASQGRR